MSRRLIALVLLLGLLPAGPVICAGMDVTGGQAASCPMHASDMALQSASSADGGDCCVDAGMPPAPDVPGTTPVAAAFAAPEPGPGAPLPPAIRTGDASRRTPPASARSATYLVLHVFLI